MNILKIANVLRLRVQSLMPGVQKFCCVCDHRVADFLPYRSGSSSRSPLMRELQVVGSDVENFACPRCGSTDRERHLFLYFEKLQLWKRVEGRRILHLAPERHLARRIAACGPEIHLCADLVASPAISVVFDLEHVPIPNDSIDLVIANHVLEHVEDFCAALREIARILRPAGLAVLQTPFSPVLDETLQLPAVRSTDARHLLYGQEDHVRLFGRDFIDYVEASGLRGRVMRHEALATDDYRYGVNRHEPLLLFEKHDATMPSQ